jgi:hypothetical protein
MRFFFPVLNAFLLTCLAALMVFFAVSAVKDVLDNGVGFYPVLVLVIEVFTGSLLAITAPPTFVALRDSLKSK